MGVLARVLRGDTEASTDATGASDGALWS